MKVVILSWRDLANPLAGGAEVMFDRVMRELAERGIDVTLLCGGPAATRDYKVVAAGGTYSQYLVIPFVCATRFRDADIVIDTENGFPYFSPVWRRRPSLCVVHHIHTDQWETRFPRPVAAICRSIELRLMPRIYRNKSFVAISQSTAASLREIGIDDKRICVIEPGVDLPTGPPPKKAAEPLYLSLNRLVPHKRVDLLLRAWELVSERVAGRLVIAGDGPELNNLRDLASRIPRTEVVGRVTEEEKSRLMGEAWLLVTSSNHEGWGMSVLEAAALGTPTLAVDAPGIRDAIEDGITGTLVRAERHLLESALADAWVDLASDSSTRTKMGAAARERSARFSWQYVAEQWVEVLEGILRETSTGSPRRRRRLKRVDPSQTEVA
jgi:glycosyltransferase involved in cell wall biosynthesis